MKKNLLTLICAAALVAPAMADWEVGDPYKMHFPQLPDENGWDVAATTAALPNTSVILADDWECSESGPITGIHFWGSWRNGVEGTIINFTLRIHADIPDPDGPGPLYSMPGDVLWELVTSDFDVVSIDAAPAWEGWYDPSIPLVLPGDHQQYFQYNVAIMDDPWVQEEGTIYWLSITAQVEDDVNTRWGWKSSEDHWNDDAVWSAPAPVNWVDLFEPDNPGQSLDLAFVIEYRPLLVIVLDRTGSMKIRRLATGNTRCQDAKATAMDDVNLFFTNNPTGFADVWTFAGSASTNLTGGFVDQVTAIAALSGLSDTGCSGLTPMAEGICDAIDAFPPSGPQSGHHLAISSDGYENNSSGQCAGDGSEVGPPPPGNYDVGSWQKKVWDKVQDRVTVYVRHWDALRDDMDVETGKPRGPGVYDGAFFTDLAASTGGACWRADGDEACLTTEPLPIPAVTEWGLVVMALMGLIVGTIMFRKARARAA